MSVCPCISFINVLWGQLNGSCTYSFNSTTRLWALSLSDIVSMRSVVEQFNRESSCTHYSMLIEALRVKLFFKTIISLCICWMDLADNWSYNCTSQQILRWKARWRPITHTLCQCNQNGFMSVWKTHLCSKTKHFPFCNGLNHWVNGSHAQPDLMKRLLHPGLIEGTHCHWMGGRGESKGFLLKWKKPFWGMIWIQIFRD